MDENEAGIAEKFKSSSGLLDEQQRGGCGRRRRARRALGYGGVSIVARATGLTRPTIAAGHQGTGRYEAACMDKDAKRRVRREGAGRPRVTDSNAGLRPALEKLVDPITRGDPESPLRWTCKSTHALVRGAVHAARHRGSATRRWPSCCASTATASGANKTVEGAQHPDRNAQFEHINAKAQDCVERRGRRSSPSTPRRRSWSATSRTADASGSPRASPSWSTSTTSRPMRSARRSRTASTTSPPTTASSASASTTTRRCSR